MSIMKRTSTRNQKKKNKDYNYDWFRLIFFSFRAPPTNRFFFALFFAVVLALLSHFVCHHIISKSLLTLSFPHPLPFVLQRNSGCERKKERRRNRKRTDVQLRRLINLCPLFFLLTFHMSKDLMVAGSV